MSCVPRAFVPIDAVRAAVNSRMIGSADSKSARRAVHRVVRDDFVIEAYDEGSGPAVVLLPSLGRGAEDFEELSPRLAAAGYRVLRPQPRGIGASNGPLRDVSLRDLTDDIIAVMEALSATPAVLVGHAFGNWIARMVASIRADLARAVVLLAASHREIPADVLSSTEKCLDMSLSPDERLRHLRIAYFASGNDASVWLHGWNTELARAQRAAGKLVPKAFWWGAGGVPILDVQAQEDAVAPRAGAGKLREELGARVTVATIPGAGHALLPEQPAAVARAVIDYLRRVSPPGSG